MQEEAYEAIAIEAQDLARAGRFDEAEQSLRSLPAASGFSGWLHEKVLALIVIASGRAQRGQAQEAAATLRVALDACQAMHAGAIWEEADCLLQIADVFERLGRRQEAIHAWVEAGDLAQANQATDADCLKILSRTARELGRVGEREQALRLARAILADEVRARTLAEIQAA